jgi:hypothetical protein
MTNAWGEENKDDSGTFKIKFDELKNKGKNIRPKTRFSRKEISDEIAKALLPENVSITNFFKYFFFNLHNFNFHIFFNEILTFLGNFI